MRQILIIMIKVELFLDAYLIVSTLCTRYVTTDCPAHPQRQDELYLLLVVIPFFVLKLIAVNCCMSPQSVIMHIALFFVLQPICCAIWEIIALTAVARGLTGCHFNLPLFNMFLLLLINLQPLLGTIIVMPYAAFRFC